MAYDMDKVMEIYHKRLDIQNMRRIFSYGRPAASEMENWWVNTYFDSAPDTSSHVSARGGTGDEVHVAVIDSTTGFFGVIEYQKHHSFV